MNTTYNSFCIGEGEPVVFQHGLAAHADQIKSLLGGLDGIRLSCIDCPGHGDTLLNDFIPSFNNYSDLVLLNADALGLEKFVVGGLSMGAGIACNIAIRYPHRVKALILHRAAWLAESNPVSLSMLKGTLSFMDDPDAKAKFQQTTVYQSIAKELPKAAESLMGVFAEGQQKELTHVIKCMVEDQPFENLSDLEKINVPTLIIANDDDPLHPYSMGEELHNRIKESKLEKVISRYVDNDKHVSQVRDIVSTVINEIA